MAARSAEVHCWPGFRSAADPWVPHFTSEPRIAPALLTAYGPEDDEATRPSPLADIHIDLPAEDESGDDPTLVELPMDDGDDNGGDTERMPL